MFKIECFATGSSGNCYLVSIDNKHFMIECGISYRTIVLELAKRKLTISDLKFIAISHEHKDHSYAIENIKKCNNKIVYGINHLVNYDDIQIIPFEVKHDCFCLGYMFRYQNETLLYATDCEYIEYDLKPFNITQVMIECNYYDLYAENKADMPFKLQRQINTHMSLSTCLKTIKSLQTEHLKEIYLIHLSDELSDEKIMKNRIAIETGVKTLVCQKYGGIK